MISMLTFIQHMDRPINGLNGLNASEPFHSPPGTGSELRELKVLSALATVLVMEHEVVAVVAKHDDRGNIGAGGVVEVIACSDSIEEEPESSKSFLNNVVATYNPRNSDRSKLKLAIHNQADDFKELTEEGLLDKFKAGTKKEKNKL